VQREHGVIFDMDGVLADTARAHFESWQMVARKWHARITRDDFRRTFGRPNHEIVPLMLHRDVPPDELREIDRFKEAAFREIIARGLEPLPGVVRLVTELDQAGFRLAIGSSGPRENIDAILSALGLEGRFGAIVSGWDVTRGKPDPEVFLKAAAGIGVEPRNCLVIEDVPAGIRAAHAAGMKCVALTTTRPAGELCEADLVLDDLTSFGVEGVERLLGIRG